MARAEVGSPQSAGRRAARLLALAVALSVAFYSGGVAGFDKGWLAARYSQSVDAQITVHILRKLRSSDATAATAIVEGQLDQLVVQNSLGRGPYCSLFNLINLVGIGSAADIDKAASAAIAYRREFPSPAQEPLRRAVSEALTQLEHRVRTEHQ